MRSLPTIVGLFLFVTFLFLLNCTGTKKTSQAPLTHSDTLRGVFYNAENLFDIQDAPGKADEDFLPDSKKQWTQGRYQRKLKDLAAVIAAIVQDQEIAFVGLAEVENRKVLEDLVQQPAIDEYSLSIIHYDSPDERGIDVAFLYNPSFLSPLKHRSIPVNFPFDTSDQTRDILYVKTKVGRIDTMHFFINHWPSRSGGVQKTEPYRLQAAQILRKQVDSIRQQNEEAEILIMGDFNDEPTNKSLQDILHAKNSLQNNDDFYLYNLMSAFISSSSAGTYNYRGEWNILDQWIISSPSFRNTDGVYVTPKSMGIYKAPWILYEKESGLKVPNKTYGGPTYFGGYSDHLPIFIDLMISQPPK